MFRPYEHIFDELNKVGNKTKLIESQAASAFYKDAEEVASIVVPARVRPKICRKCNTVQTKHSFPRKKQFFIDKAAGKTVFVKDLNKAVYYGCHGYKVETCRYCVVVEHNANEGTGLVAGSSDSTLDFAVGSAFATCHGCIFSASASASAPAPAPAPASSVAETTTITSSNSKKRKIPPQYYDLVGKKVPRGKETQSVEAANMVVTGLYRSPGNILNPTTPLQLCAVSSLGGPLYLDGKCSSEQIVRYGHALGMFSAPIASSEAVKAEICGIYNLMLGNYREKPAWEGVIHDIVTGAHRNATLGSQFEIKFEIKEAIEE